MSARIVSVFCVLSALGLFVMFAAALGSNSPAVSTGGSLLPGTVPPEYEAWVIKAGSQCTEITPPLIAAQIDVESNWNPRALSPARAKGLSQFMDGTWPTYGRDDDLNGRSDPFDPADAIMAQGRFDCAAAETAKRDLASGRVTGELLDIVMVAYNCGYGCVLDRGGPQGTTGGAESDSYPSKVKAALPKYSLPSTPVGPGFIPGGPFGTNVVAAAMTKIGLPYAWGGGDRNGPTRGISDGGVADSYGDSMKTGFDCSGLVLYAVAQASGGAILLSHLDSDQVADPRGQRISDPAQLQPGDIIQPHSGHIFIWLGNNSVVEAPQSGDFVKVSSYTPSASGLVARRFG
ncbi:hypothetical protein GCM10007304_14240 [Rhodococcoides trifolii]|uniref:NlpC/P60 domain-containing protein n=1 Tax=Rhodococcoides trifolii TaxID=908250 RepID=A0A917CZ56_9NOCA|nr:transglycosylase SLT domain-containing protein [Rhodococcus trifolii]GGG01416.1 hypothetical protein GCM10007304_14240 [Rhodococcus trifolii]